MRVHQGSTRIQLAVSVGRMANTCLCFDFTKRCHHCLCSPGTKQINHSAGGTVTSEPYLSTLRDRSAGTPGMTSGMVLGTASREAHSLSGSTFLAV